jgi:hypothetical protein
MPVTVHSDKGKPVLKAGTVVKVPVAHRSICCEEKYCGRQRLEIIAAGIE